MIIVWICIGVMVFVGIGLLTSFHCRIQLRSKPATPFQVFPDDQPDHPLEIPKGANPVGVAIGKTDSMLAEVRAAKRRRKDWAVIRIDTLREQAVSRGWLKDGCSLEEVTPALAAKFFDRPEDTPVEKVVEGRHTYFEVWLVDGRKPGDPVVGPPGLENVF
jgi:hypothetical protein